MTVELQTIESRLRAQRSQILSDIRDRLHAAGDPEKLSLLNHLDEGTDWVAADLLNDTDILLLSHELAMLTEVDSALARIKDGSYGICMNCGDRIPSARLDAQLTARFCLACQERFEKSHGEHSAAI